MQLLKIINIDLLPRAQSPSSILLRTSQAEGIFVRLRILWGRRHAC